MFLGIDIGTSSVKVVLLDTSSQLLDTVTTALELSHPKPLWFEQHPQDWWAAVNQSIATLRARHSLLLSQVEAIGLTGQMHGAVFLDASGEALRPAILWNDGRSHAECQQLLERVPDAVAITGNMIAPGFTAPKWLWLQNNEPELAARVAKILLPKDYIRYQLSGDFATDLSDAAGTSWLALRDRNWSETILSACGLTLEHMPKVYEGNAVTGTIRGDLAKEWGLSSECKIIAGGGDNAASAISVNVIEAGSAFLSLGTSGVFFVADDAVHCDQSAGVHTMCHALPECWHRMAVHLNAAGTIDVMARQLFGKADPDRLDMEATRAEMNKQLIFLPYLNGERTPHNDPFALGAFFGLTHDTERSMLARSVLEGLAFALCWGKDAVEQSGTALRQILLMGGGTQNTLFTKILASVWGCPLSISTDPNVGAALGAARLAALACGLTVSDLPEPVVCDVIEPDLSTHDYYQDKFQRFKALYAALKPLTVPKSN